MENKECLKEKFANKCFIAYVTAGEPSIEGTKKYVEALDKGRADIIEIGIPFSDPVVEGPVIAAACERALARGVTTDMMFNMCEELNVSS